jgi:hypothetical protein
VSGTRRIAVVLAAVVVVIAVALLMTRPSKRAADARGHVPDSPRFEKPQDALFTDDFSDGLSRWKADHEGIWQVENGVLRARLPDKKQQRSFLRAGDPDWTDYAVDVDVCMTRGADKGVAVRVAGKEGVAVDLRGAKYQDALLHRGMKRLGKAKVRNANGEWHHIRFEVRGTRYTVFVNEKKLIEAEESERKRGGIALAAYTGGVAKCTVYYDNVAVTRLDASRGN